MRNIYDKLLNINFDEITGLKMDDETDKKYLRELGKAEIEARKQELLLGTTRNRVINDNFDQFNEIQQKAYGIAQHGDEKSVKKINTSRIWKDIGAAAAILSATILGGFSLVKGGIFVFGAFGGPALLFSIVGVIGIAGLITYGIASYFKNSNETKRLSGLLSASEALVKNSPVVQASLDTSTYTKPKDISRIKNRKVQVCDPINIEPHERFYKDKDKDDDDDKDDNNQERDVDRFVINVNNKRSDSSDQEGRQV